MGDEIEKFSMVDLIPWEILEHIFQYVDLQELIVLRCVNRLICQLATPFFLQKLAKVEVKFELENCSAKNHNKLLKYLEYLKTGTSIIYPNICIFNIDMDQETVQHFLNKFGDLIKTLRVTFSDIELFLALIRQILVSQCKNLQKITLSLRNLYNSSNSRLLLEEERQEIEKYGTKIKEICLESTDCSYGMQYFYQDLFLLCPKLESVRQIATSSDCRDNFLIPCLIQSERWGGIKHLGVSYPFSYSMEKMANFGGQIYLKTLRYQRLLLACIKELNKFLDTQANSLEELYIQDFEQYQLNPIKLPFLPKLKVLEIGGNATSDTPLELAEIKMTQQFSSLRKLILPKWKNCINVRAFFGSPVQPHLNLQVLHLPAGLSLEKIQSFGVLFPNVDELSASFQWQTVIQEIWKQWPRLKVYFCFCMQPNNALDERGLDALLTGFSTCQMENARMSLLRGDIYSEHPEFPSISNLKELVQLTIHIGGNQDKITDISAVYAFMKLPYLKYLTVNASEFSPTVCKMLQEKLVSLKTTK